ncbi:MAG TPA: hypothetical protein VFV67_11600 [Actinophytocola sp.]|uniref:hypothetical protein n=1 Tax=Actinophytocola sp. TaxID=1872138 RepID=UPI002DBE721B|nr:hypothetical protein [Actinophytocola sp.]HEU5471290.1 hypothetical protein [Actinophytocola sp.]
MSRHGELAAAVVAVAVHLVTLGSAVLGLWLNPGRVHRELSSRPDGTSPPWPDLRSVAA